MAKTLTGVVSSSKPDKTIVITVQTRKTHPIYKKQYTETAKFMAHDEKNEAHEGDKVVISETRPLSARKRYKLDKIVERATITKDDLNIISDDATAEKSDVETDKESEK